MQCKAFHSLDHLDTVNKTVKMRLTVVVMGTGCHIVYNTNTVILFTIITSSDPARVL